MKPNDMSSDKMKDLLQMASQKMSMSQEQLKNQLENPMLQKTLNNLSPDKAKKLQEIINNPKLFEQLLSNPQAQAMLKQYLEG